MGNARSQLPPQEVTTFNNDDVNAATDAHCDPSPVTAIQNVDTARKYTFQQIDGEFTVVDLAEMEFSRDDRFFKLRTRDLPADFWVYWRLQRNRRRSLRTRTRLKERRTAEASAAATQHTSQELETQTEAKRAAGRLQADKINAAFENGMRIVIDCSFATAPHTTPTGLLLPSSDKEIRSLARQLAYCVAANRRAVKPGMLIFAGFSGALKEFAQVRMGGAGWKAHMHVENSLKVIPPGSKVVVMSPDADEALTSVDPGTTYVIGGLVDRTVQKGATRTFAERAAWPARRLPMEEYLEDSGSPVLNVNDVVAALLAVHGGADWKTALEEVVPQRRKKKPGKR